MIERYELKVGIIFSLFVAVITAFSRIARLDAQGYLFIPISVAYTFCLSILCWIVLQTIIKKRIPIASLNTMVVKCLFGVFLCAVISLLYRPVNGTITSRMVVIQELTRRQINFVLILRGIFFGVTQLLTMYYFDALRATEQSRLENETLKRDNLQARLSALQQQISPHFLFNALNTIQTLTSEETVKQYTVQLAAVYRYLLQYRESNLVTLEEELRFIQSYLYIQTTRFEDALQVTIAVDPSVLCRRVPPLSVQIVLENAIKHNVISSSRPLHIRFFNEGDTYLVVENTMQPKSSLEETTKFGIQNIIDRYKLLSTTSPSFSQTAEYYTVKLPLLA